MEDRAVVSAAGRVSVVIPAFNGGAALRRCLESLVGSARQPDGIIVVDNASTDGSIASLMGSARGVEFLMHRDNLGFAAACNRGIAMALDRGHDYVLLLNQDTRMGPDTLGSLLQLAESRPRAAAIGCRTLSPATTAGGMPILLYGGAWRTWLPLWQHVPGIGGPSASMPTAPCPVDFVWGHAMLLRADALRDVGLLDPGFFLYCEDIELCDRLGRAGWERWCDRRAVVWHDIRDAARATDSEAWRWHVKAVSFRRYCRLGRVWWRADFAWGLTMLRHAVYMLRRFQWRAAAHLARGMWLAARGIPVSGPRPVIPSTGSRETA